MPVFSDGEAIRIVDGTIKTGSDCACCNETPSGDPCTCTFEDIFGHPAPVNTDVYIEAYFRDIVKNDANVWKYFGGVPIYYDNFENSELEYILELLNGSAGPGVNYLLFGLPGQNGFGGGLGTTNPSPTFCAASESFGCNFLFDWIVKSNSSYQTYIIYDATDENIYLYANVLADVCGEVKTARWKLHSDSLCRRSVVLNFDNEWVNDNPEIATSTCVLTTDQNLLYSFRPISGDDFTTNSFIIDYYNNNSGEWPVSGEAPTGDISYTGESPEELFLTCENDTIATGSINLTNSSVYLKLVEFTISPNPDDLCVPAIRVYIPNDKRYMNGCQWGSSGPNTINFSESHYSTASPFPSHTSIDIDKNNLQLEYCRANHNPPPFDDPSLTGYYGCNAEWNDNDVGTPEVENWWSYSRRWEYTVTGEISPGVPFIDEYVQTCEICFYSYPTCDTFDCWDLWTIECEPYLGTTPYTNFVKRLEWTIIEHERHYIFPGGPDLDYSIDNRWDGATDEIPTTSSRPFDILGSWLTHAARRYWDLDCECWSDPVDAADVTVTLS